MLSLRTCGHFSLVKSDYGTEYKTTDFITPEALYASLTRGRTRKFGAIFKNMSSDFFKWYEVEKELIWFLPGIFNSYIQKDEYVFNVIDELKPSTNKYSNYKKGEWQLSERKLLPTYGTIEVVKPNQIFTTWALSSDKKILNNYATSQVFLLGKKRTMVQITDVSEITELKNTEEQNETWPLPLQIEDFNKFKAYELLWHTPRYVVGKGVSEDVIQATVALRKVKITLTLPKWWLDKLFWLKEEIV
jgi:hypothetical protein